MRENARSQKLRVIPAQVRSLDGQTVDLVIRGRSVIIRWWPASLPQLGGAEAARRFRCQRNPCVKVYPLTG